MARTATRVDRVKLADDAAVQRFAHLWVQSQVATGHSSDWAERTAGGGTLQAALARDDVRIYLATNGDEAAGFAVVVDGPLSSLSEHPASWIEQLYVAQGARCSGVSKALLAQVARDAQGAGAGQLVSCVPSQARDLNRYFARLGFVPSITERTVSPAQLLRRLSGADESAAGAVVRRRKSLQARARARVRMAHTGG